MIDPQNIPASTSKEELAQWKRLLDILRVLRSDEGCPWDKEQTLASLRPHIIEEPTELLQAIGNLLDNPSRAAHEHVKEELGDVLLVLTMMIIVYDAEQSGQSTDNSNNTQANASTNNSHPTANTFAEILAKLNTKLIRRHPHVFDEVTIDNSEQLAKQWNKIKSEQEGKAKESLVDYKSYMHVLERTKELQKRLARDYGKLKEPISDKTKQLAGQIKALAQLAQYLPNTMKKHNVDNKVSAYTPTPDFFEKAIGDALYHLIDIARVFKVSPTSALSRKLVFEIEANSLEE